MNESHVFMSHRKGSQPSLITINEFQPVDNVLIMDRLTNKYLNSSTSKPNILPFRNTTKLLSIKSGETEMTTDPVRSKVFLSVTNSMPTTKLTSNLAYQNSPSKNYQGASHNRNITKKNVQTQQQTTKYTPIVISSREAL